MCIRIIYIIRLHINIHWCFAGLALSAAVAAVAAACTTTTPTAEAKAALIEIGNEKKRARAIQPYRR